MRESFFILDTDADGLVSRPQVENLVYRIDPDMTHDEMADLLDTADLDGMFEFVKLCNIPTNIQLKILGVTSPIKNTIVYINTILFVS